MSLLRGVPRTISGPRDGEKGSFLSEMGLKHKVQRERRKYSGNLPTLEQMVLLPNIWASRFTFRVTSAHFQSQN